MNPPVNSSSELPEFLAAVSSASGTEAALRIGVTRIAETFDAEVAAIVKDDRVLASTGFRRGAVPTEELCAAAAGNEPKVVLPPLGPVAVSVVGLDGDDFVTVVARAGDPLDAAELAHAQALTRILALALQLLDQLVENEQLLREHEKHEAMLEAILRIQRLISQRRHIDTILESITTEAASLLSADLAGVCLVTPSGVPRIALAVGSGAEVDLGKALPEAALVKMGERAASNELVVPRRFVLSLDVVPEREVEVTAIGAPVFDDGATMGGLFVLSMGSTDHGIDIEPAAVETFASQASIALTDASTMDELHHAFHDTLTGLANRALFQDRFEHAVALGDRLGTRTALLFIDLDRFKAVNDTFGHAAGDKLLKSVANSLAETGRSYDSVARLGGDEFAVLLENTDEEAAALVATRLLDGISKVENPASKTGVCSASIGIAVTEPGCHTTDELLRRADIAMYAAKGRGRCGVAVYDQSMGSSRLDQQAMADALLSALVRHDFVVHYQPIVSLQTRQIVGAEALVRWRDPERGILNPAEFIQAAEDTGMIVPIGRRVLQMACKQAAEWRRTIPSASGFNLSVNLSGRQLQSDGIRDDIVSALEESGLDPAALTLEVTESTFVDDADDAGSRLRALKELGVRLAIDDFGTGFSSLSYIHHYPFDILKVDRMFVTGLGTTANSGALVKTLLALAQQLSMTTVAEGIESPVELAQLRALRCSHGQGFLFSRPVDPGSFELLFSERGRLLGTGA